jgi:lipopolysaccharide export system permease protein
MGAIGRYIVRTTFGAFLLVLVSLTLLVWLTHALRDIDIVTNQGQTVLVFVGITTLLIPALVLVIAPLAYVIAAVYALNKLNTDSEIVVMNAAGMSPWRIFIPFLSVALLVSALVGAISIYLGPKCLQELRTLVTRVRADLIANVLQPGRFTSLQGGLLTFHIRERRPNGELGGIFIDDRRDPELRATFLAERGIVIENDSGSFLLLENGSAQRVNAKEPDPTIVLFERYGFDMTQFSGANYSPTFNVKERFLKDLLWPDPEDPYYKQNQSRFGPEIADRLTAPVYPIVFALVCFAILGAPRTSRQSRGLSILMAVVSVAVLRIVGFATIVFSAKVPSALFGLYAVLGATTIVSLLVMSRGTVVEPPAFLIKGLSGLQARLSPQPASS